MGEKAKFAFPWEEKARNGKPVPKNLSFPDMMAYTALRGIYAAYNAKTIDAKAAGKEKGKLRRLWDKAKEDEAFRSKHAKHYVELIMATEIARAACRKDPTPENALRLCAVLDGMNLRQALKELEAMEQAAEPETDEEGEDETDDG